MSKIASKTEKEVEEAELSAAIRALRKDLRFTQVQFAAELDITPTTIYRYEAGTNTPTNDLLARMLQLAVKKQALEGVQNLAEHLAKRTGLNLFGGSEAVSDVPLLRAVASLRLERRILIMAAVLMETEGKDETALRVFESLVKPWIARVSDSFGPLDVAFNAESTRAARSVRTEGRLKEK